ncbi:MAG: 1-(5-phosphoribosyl)-5-[Lachnospiraceae bacterium]|nr:1-(5-phosphoribosyl)-5-[(5-phosphoribosylamino)methylideneamino]imidazole-4-carboxamide isomerase [Lachnospiraceae bacterium]
MRIYPAIDIRGGKCVRLRQGVFADMTVYNDDPVKVALGFKEKGAEYIHVVDLDGALEGYSVNAKVISDIARETGLPVQTGGGIRTLNNIEKKLQTGVARVIIGTKAVKEPEFVKEAIENFGAEHIVAGLDGRNGRAAVSGWEKESDMDIIELALQFKGYGLKTVVYTDISRDGMLTGPDFDYTSRLVSETGLDIIASGGVGSEDDIDRIAEKGVEGVITGKAIYEGKINLERVLKKYSSIDKKGIQ